MSDAIEAEFVAEPSAALAVREPGANVALFGSDDPVEVIEKAVRVADALKSVIASKGLVKKIGGREYVEIAGWQTLGAMMRLSTICEWSRPLENGFEARVLVHAPNGAVIGSAEAQCTRDEKTWSNRDDYALRSMAQTRACSKALRSVLGFVVVLAGYKDTPADEMPGAEDSSVAPSAPRGTPLTPPREYSPSEPPQQATQAPQAAKMTAGELVMARAKINGLLSDNRITPTEKQDAIESVLGPGGEVGKVQDLETLRDVYKAVQQKIKAVTNEIPL